MQKKMLKILFLAGLLIHPIKISSQSAELPTVVITEIGAFEPAETEWIEIYNKSGTTTDLTDWKFFEDATNHKLAAIRGDALLEPAEFAVIASKADLFIQKYPEYTGTVFDSSWGSLKEDGEEIGLKDANGNLMELFTYPVAGTSTSLERIDVHLPASDAANWGLHPTSHSLGQLREILAPTNPEPPPQPQPEPPQPAPPLPELPLPEPPPSESPPEPTIPADLSLPAEASREGGPPQPPVSSSRVYVPALPKVPAPSPPRPSTIPAIPSEAIFNLRGYFVFIPYDTSTTPPSKKAKKSPSKTAVKKSKKAKKQKKPVKTATFQNGDLSNLIKITEIFPNPSPEENTDEWIEIFNGDNRPRNLGNWSFSDASHSQKSPHPIPESVILAPKSYSIFPKSETKLALNNEGDEILLRDFEGNIVDRVSYEQSKPGQSYALVAIEKSNDLVASREWFSVREKSTWEWIDEPTPGKPNPTFSKLEGAVSRFLAGGETGGESTFDITLFNGVSKKIRFSEETLDPLMAEVVLKEGTSVSLQAQKSNEDIYDLKKIEEVRPAPTEAAESPPSEEKKNFSWIIVAIIGVGVILNMIPLIRALLRKLG